MNSGELLGVLRDNFPLYAEECLTIIGTDARPIPFKLKPAQQRIEEAAREQEAAGRPVRLIVPKARKEGVSTYATGKLVHRATLNPNHNAIAVAQDGDTSGELLQLAQFMHGNLPDHPTLQIRPPLANRLRRKELMFGNPARNAQVTGDFGINSRIMVQPAGEFEAGRGYTYHSVHASEAAFWPDLKRKLTSLLNAVPDEPGTFILLESTSNSYNHWRTLCMQALEGSNDFTCVFLAWFEEPQYTRPFLSEEEREAFRETVGTGPYGDDEPDLIANYGLTLEQLHWRRWAIANRCQGDLRLFKQEYPATLDESFLSTGTVVFNPMHVDAVRRELEDRAEQPETGRFEATDYREVPSKFGHTRMPTGAKWVRDRAGAWLLWDQPDKDDQFVIGGDPAGDEVMDEDTSAMHACQVIDHRTRVQVAELEFQGDPDEFAEQIMLAALFFNRAWVAVESTGGYGYSINRRIHYEWRHPFMYRRRSLESRKDKASDRLGWDTNRATRQFLIDGAVEMLREGSHGIRSPRLVKQLGTFVRDGRGKPVPAPGERSDLLMSWMIAQHVAQEQPVRKSHGSGPISTTTRDVVNLRTGW